MVADAPKLSVSFGIAEDARGARIDKLVAELLPTTRAEARALCEGGAVRLDGRRVRKGTRVEPGATLDIDLPSQTVVEPEPDAPLDVRLERPDLVVVHKPSGIATVPLRRGERGTVASALLGRYPEMLGIGHGPREPGVIHRLDTQTSGLIVAARNGPTFTELTEGLRAGRLAKRYLAVCESAGLSDTGEIDLALCPDPDEYGRVIVAPPDARYRHVSATKYRVLVRGVRFALVELEVSRAFRHQIRAHLAAIGNPIAGDRLYGGAGVAALGERHALHASYVAWAGERTPTFEVSTEAPELFRAVVADAET